MSQNPVAKTEKYIPGDERYRLITMALSLIGTLPDFIFCLWLRLCNEDPRDINVSSFRFRFGLWLRTGKHINAKLNLVFFPLCVVPMITIIGIAVGGIFLFPKYYPEYAHPGWGTMAGGMAWIFLCASIFHYGIFEPVSSLCNMAHGKDGKQLAAFGDFLQELSVSVGIMPDRLYGIDEYALRNLAKGRISTMVAEILIKEQVLARLEDERFEGSPAYSQKDSEIREARRKALEVYNFLRGVGIELPAYKSFWPQRTA